MSESGNNLDYMPLVKQYLCWLTPGAISFHLGHTFLGVSLFSRLYVYVSWLAPIVVERSVHHHVYCCRHCSLDKLQRIINAAARVVSDTHKFDHGLTSIRPNDLHWLDVPERVTFRLLPADPQHRRAPSTALSDSR